MTHPTPNITVKVDVTNPGQFFACCGLLELADRLWPGAEGWFEEDHFCVSCEHNARSVNDLISLLLDCPEFLPGVTKRSVLADNKMKLLPVVITIRESVLRIDWWRDEISPPSNNSRETCAASEFKTWAGNQSPQQIIYDRLLPALRQVIQSNAGDWFHRSCPLTGRFGFDHTSAVTALDVGWSPDKQAVVVSTSPAIEILAMIGLQRFRPRRIKKPPSFYYCTWSFPLPCLIAPAYSSASIGTHGCQRYLFEIAKRGDYKFFTTATPQGTFQ